MAKRNRSSGFHAKSEHARGLGLGTHGPAGPAISLVTGEVFSPTQAARPKARRPRDDRQQRRLERVADSPSERGGRPCAVCGARQERHWVTDGMKPNGTLRVLTFCSPEHVAAGRK